MNVQQPLSFAPKFLRTHFCLNRVQKSSNTLFRLIFTDIGLQSMWLDKSFTISFILSKISFSDWANVLCYIVSAGNSETLLFSLSLSKTTIYLSSAHLAALVSVSLASCFFSHTGQLIKGVLLLSFKSFSR